MSVTVPVADRRGRDAGAQSGPEGNGLTRGRGDHWSKSARAEPNHVAQAPSQVRRFRDHPCVDVEIWVRPLRAATVCAGAEFCPPLRKKLVSLEVHQRVIDEARTVVENYRPYNSNRSG